MAVHPLEILCCFCFFLFGFGCTRLRNKSCRCKSFLGSAKSFLVLMAPMSKVCWFCKKLFGSDGPTYGPSGLSYGPRSGPHGQFDGILLAIPGTT